VTILAASLAAAGCAHYPINQPLKQYDPEVGYRGKNLKDPAKDEHLLILVSFSGGGDPSGRLFLRGARDVARYDGLHLWSAEAPVGRSGRDHGRFRRELHGGLLWPVPGPDLRGLRDPVPEAEHPGQAYDATFFNPINWVKLFSPYYDRSDLAAEYYDKHVFDGATFGDLLARKEPMIFINATDMVHGTRMAFIQDAFDVICSDLSTFPVARACAASSAVPMVLSPITLRN